ncbi:hypothetical protein D3C80_1566340 [compost metagenome]
MHAPVLLGKIEKAAHGSGNHGAAPQVQGVEDANIDIRVDGQGGDYFFLAVAGSVIEQHPYAHAAIGCQQQFAHQGAGAEAVMYDVILKIDAFLRVADQFGACPESFTAVGQQAETREPFMLGCLSQDRAPECRIAGGNCLTEIMR